MVKRHVAPKETGSRERPARERPRRPTTAAPSRESPSVSATRSRTRRSRWPFAAVCAFAAAFFVQSLSSSLKKSATYDEPMHIAAGLSYLETGRIVVSPEHPPLLKELSAVVLQSAGVRWPATAQATAAANGDPQSASSVARSIIVDNGPDRVMFWARLPLILVATTLVFAVYMLGRRLAGETAAVGAALLCAFDPNILAHSFLVTTDVGVATFLVLFMVALWDYVNRASRTRAIVCGIALGAALAAKYSAVILPPLAVLLMLAAVRWPTEATQVIDSAKPRGAKEKPDPTQPAFRRLLRYATGFVVMCVAAFLVLQVVYLFPRNPFQYLSGWSGIYGRHVEGFQGYMHGQLAPRFYSYYIVAFLLKEPLATIALSLIGLLIVVRDRSMHPLTRTFLLLPPVMIVAGYTVMSYNIGIRYLMPALPFAYLLGGVALAKLFHSARAPARAVAGVLCVWLLLAAIGIYPDHLSYFNEAACVLDDPRKLGLDGGSRCGPAWLDDSNVDWGQGLKQLKDWLDRNAAGRQVRLGYFGTIPPQAYGIRQIPMSNEDLLNGNSPGLYAVSAHIVASTPAVAFQARGGGAEWLRRARPVAVVGHAYYIFDVPERRPAP
jgi:hypothetical protein